MLRSSTFKLHIFGDVIFEESKRQNWDSLKINDKGGEFKLLFGSDPNREDVNVHEASEDVIEIPKEMSVG